ncbi:MAG: LemA family protein [Thermodesulfovibrionales bacterium]|nr:LemA family protein [Thermodesulfovibrionales bacterium]
MVKCKRYACIKRETRKYGQQSVVVWVLILSAVIPLFWIIIIYNSLVSLRNDVTNAWHQIDVQLKRRHDLIPNLVSVVKGYMEYERNVLERITTVRTKAITAADMRAKAAAEDSLTQSLKSLFAVMENYPVLKSNENVMELQEELVSTENKIAFSRQLYNDLVANLATKIEIFPNNMVSSLFGFRKTEYFSADGHGTNNLQGTEKHE